MTHQTKNPVLAGTGSVECSARRRNISDHTPLRENVQHEVQATRLRSRFGMPRIRADLIASHAFSNGGAT